MHPKAWAFPLSSYWSFLPLSLPVSAHLDILLSLTRLYGSVSNTFDCGAPTEPDLLFFYTQLVLLYSLHSFNLPHPSLLPIPIHSFPLHFVLIAYPPQWLSFFLFEFPLFVFCYYCHCRLLHHHLSLFLLFSLLYTLLHMLPFPKWTFSGGIWKSQW